MDGHEITVSLSLIFSIVAAIGVLYNIFATHRRDEEADDKKELEMQKNFTKLEVKLDEFGRQMSEVVRRSEKSGDKLESIGQEITKQNERISTLFRLHDDHERRLKELERDNNK